MTQLIQLKYRRFVLIALAFWGASSEGVQGQNVVSNGTFEAYDSLPYQDGQLSFASDWDIVIISADFLYTNSYNGWQPEIGFAHNGYGYAGFATYGDSNGSSEAIGQDISGNPLEPGISYQIEFFSKMPYMGTQYGDYSNVCGGVQLYGSNSPPNLNLIGVHPSQFSGMQLLWSSNTISSTTWVGLSGCFNVSDTIKYIVLSGPRVPGCAQYLFIDDLSITSSETIDILGPDISFCDGSSSCLDATIDYPDVTYSWDNGSTSPMRCVDTAGTYWVSVDANCGVFHDTIVVDTIDCSVEVEFPNIFTPNGDGHNDHFTSYSFKGITTNSFEVYNRWGQLMYASEDEPPIWNGNNYGNPCSEGTYYYILKFGDILGNSGYRKGTFFLNR